MKKLEIIVLVAMTLATGIIFGSCLEKRWNYTHPQEPNVIMQTVYMDIDEIDEENRQLNIYKQAQLDIFKVCQEFDLCYPIVFSICRLETGNFSSKAFLNGNWNYCGITIGGDVKTFENKEQGLLALAQTMEYYKGLTIDQMAKTYCPPNYKQWTKSVKQIVKEEGGDINATL